MKNTFVKRLVVLVSIGVAGMLLSGNVAAAQEDADGANLVASHELVAEDSANAQPAGVCQDPPCNPPPPDKVGTCFLRIDPVPFKDENNFVEVTAIVQCVKGTGDPLIMQRIEMDLQVVELGVGGGTSHTDAHSVSQVPDTFGIAHHGHCTDYKGFADVWLTWPSGWVGDRALSVRTAQKRIC
jgi:hypothetical protein